MVVHVGNHHSIAELMDKHHHVSLHVMIQKLYIWEKIKKHGHDVEVRNINCQHFVERYNTGYQIRSNTGCQTYQLPCQNENKI